MVEIRKVDVAGMKAATGSFIMPAPGAAVGARADEPVIEGPRALLSKWGAWRGTATGRFHIEFSGMKTDPRFWPAFKPTRPGRVRIALPRFGVQYLETLAVTASLSAAQGHYASIEVGAGWGPISVRATLLARRLGLRAHATWVEPIPENQQRIHTHMAVNGLSPAVHRIVGAAIGETDGLTWMKIRKGDTLGAREIAAREVEVALSVAPGAAPCWPGVKVALRDDAYALCVNRLSLQSLLQSAPLFDLLHIRFPGSISRIVATTPLLSEKVNFLLVPYLADDDCRLAHQLLGGLGFAPMFVTPAGEELRDGATPFTMGQAFGFWANTTTLAADVRARIAKDFSLYRQPPQGR